MLKPSNVLFVAFLAFVGCDSASDSREEIVALSCQFPNHDFAEITTNHPVEHRFTIINSSNADIDIERIMTTCGCTSAKLATRRLKPGQNAAVDVSVRLVGHMGRVESDVVIFSKANGAMNPPLILSVRGSANPAIHVSSTHLKFVPLPENTRQSSLIELVAADGEPDFEVRSVELTHPQLTSEIEILEDGRHYRIRVNAGLFSDLGYFQERALIHTTHPKETTIPIEIYGRVVGSLYWYPETILIPDGGDQALLTSRLIYVGPGTAKDFQIHQVKPSLQTISTEIVPLQTGGYVIRLDQIPHALKLKDQYISVMTDQTEYPEFRIPFKVFDLPPAEGG